MNKINAWIEGARGRAMNPDGAYGLQCKDVIDDYCLYLFGNWTNTIRAGNANVCFSNANPDFFAKIANNPSDANQIPQRGDVVVWGSMQGNPYGHIAVVTGASGDKITMIEQDGYRQVPAYETTRGYVLGGSWLIGWLRPKANKIIGNQEKKASINTQKGGDVDIIKSMYWRLLGREADQGGINHYLEESKKNGWGFVYMDLKNSDEGQADWQRRSPERVNQLENKIKELTSQVEGLRNGTGSQEIAKLKSQNDSLTQKIKELEAGINRQPEQKPDNNQNAETLTLTKENNGLLKSLVEMFKKVFRG